MVPICAQAAPCSSAVTTARSSMTDLTTSAVGSIVITTLAPRTAAAGVGATVAPAATSGSAADGERSQTVADRPAASRFLAIAAPIIPVPSTAVVSIASPCNQRAPCRAANLAKMPRHVALLRGINVGGHNKVAMADLRQIAVDLGYTEVSTYIQSGNLLFTAGGDDTAGLGAALERSIADRLGIRPVVVVLSEAGLGRVISDNPFPDAPNPRLVHAVLRNTELSEKGRTAVAAAVSAARASGSRDEAVIVGRTLFLHTPDGFGRSQLAVKLTTSAAQDSGTARNWATVTKLMSLLTGE